MESLTLITTATAIFMATQEEAPPVPNVIPVMTAFVTGIVVPALTFLGIWLTARYKRRSEAESAAVTKKQVDTADWDAYAKRQASDIEELKAQFKELNEKFELLEGDLNKHTLWGYRVVWDYEARGLTAYIPQPLPPGIIIVAASPPPTTPPVAP